MWIVLPTAHPEGKFCPPDSEAGIGSAKMHSQGGKEEDGRNEKEGNVKKESNQTRGLGSNQNSAAAHFRRRTMAWILHRAVSSQRTESHLASSGKTFLTRSWPLKHCSPTWGQGQKGGHGGQGSPSFLPLAFTICVTALRPCHSILRIQCLSSSGQLNTHSNKGPGKVLWQPEDRAIKRNGCRLLRILPCARDCAKRLAFSPLNPQWSHEFAPIATFISHRQK